MMGASAGCVGNGGIENHAVGDVFAFAEEREENDRGDNQNLQNDRDEKSATLVAANAFFLGGITFDEAASQKTGWIFGKIRISHHTPPETGPARRGRFAVPVS